MAYGDKAASSSDSPGPSNLPKPSVAGAIVPLNQELETAKITDADFVTSVLTPYGITLDEQDGDDGVPPSLRSLFGFLDQAEERGKLFAAHSEEFPLRIWLGFDEEEMRQMNQQYRALTDFQSNEAEFQALALEKIFLDEVRVPRNEQRSDEKIVPIRMLQPVHKPSSSSDPLWKAPPRFTLEGKQYEWDIGLDCAYYISLRAFPPCMKYNIKSIVSILSKQATCPYFAIQFKKDGETLETAKYRIAIASTLAVYNRWRLKRRALKIYNEYKKSQEYHDSPDEYDESPEEYDDSPQEYDDFPEDQKDHLQYYSIIFAGSEWSLWRTRPKTYDDWSGCTVTKIFEGDCYNLESSQLLMSIINEIHYWGLTVHGLFCVADVKIVAGRFLGEKPWDPETEKFVQVYGAHIRTMGRRS